MDPFTLLILPLLQPVIPVAAPVPAPYEVVQIPTLPDAGKAEAIINTQKPEVSLSRWNGEAQIKVSYLGVEAPAIPGTTSGSYIWKGTEASVEAFPIEANPEIVDGGFEFQVVLHEMPPGNIFDFAVEGAENMDFNYQAPLDEAFKVRNVSPKAVRCTPTQCFGKDGEVVSERPENVVGSYAVYAKDKKNHEIGGLNYGMGKMFHIYRPKAIAADGQWVWGTLDYKDDILSVTVPEDFLDRAAYPIIVDPTYGYTSLGASEDATDGCSIYYHAGTFSGTTGSTLGDAHWYGRRSSGSGSSTVYVGLYSTGAVGSKTRRDFVSGSLSLTTTKTSYAISGGSYSGLTNGTAYFIEMNSNLGSGWRNEYDDTGTASSLTYHCDWGSAPPDPSGASETDEPSLNWSFSAYWDYTEPASAPTVTTSAASSVTSSTATLNGNVTATGGAAATTCGFAWGTGSGLAGGDTATTTDSTCPASTGAFTKNLSSLSSNTTYYFRAYATNTGGTGLGSILNFTTSSAAAARTAIVKPANNLGLVGYWPMNEATSTKAGDFSGFGNTGILSTSGSNLPQWVSGKFGKALVFDGSTNYVAIPAASALEITSDKLTLSAWVKLDALSGDRTIVRKDGAANDWNLILTDGFGGNKFRFEINNGSHPQVVDTSDAVVGVWYHVVGVYDGANINLYVDGIYKNQTAATGNMTADPTGVTWIGADSSALGQRLFAGTIDDVRVYSRALTAAQVLTLFKQGAARVVASTKTLQQGSTLTNGLVGLWTFDGGDINWTSDSAGVAYDGSGNNNIGTLTNMSKARSPTIGKLGQALTFDGAAHYVAVGNVGTIKTVSFWIKPTASASKKIIDMNGTAQIETNGSSQITATSFPAATVYVDGAVGSAIDTGWHFVTVTDSTGVSASAMDIGRVSSTYYPGVFDDVRVYNRALTAPEVKQLYLLGRVLVKP